VCHSGARKLSGRVYSVEEVWNEVIKDRVFYRNTSGGVTLSGGEITLYPDFADALLTRCREEGIHTAVETCGYAPWESLAGTVRNCDLILYDIKLIDSERARIWTGAGNDLVLENAGRLASGGKHIVVRVPLVPGVNTDDGELVRIAEFVRSLGSIGTLHILPFHHFGRSKYEALGMAYPLDGMEEPDAETIDRCEAIAERHGLKVDIGGSDI
jgi:pyruvate formate lyase activating enzyme